MKRILSFTNVLLAAMVLWFCWGCDDAVNNAITDNRAYIRDSFDKKTISVFLEGNGEEIVTVPVNVTRRDDTRDIQVTVGISEEALAAYNHQYSKTYKMYPQNLWRFESDKVIIRKGTTGAGANILVQPLTPELQDSGDIFVIPVAVVDADEGVGVLKGEESVLCVVKSTPVATVAGVPNTADPMFVYLPHPSTEDNQVRNTAITIEFLIQLTSKINAHNYALIYNDGGWVGGHYFSRIEGAGSGWNNAVFEWGIGGGREISVAPPGGIALNRWYHIAFTYGNKKIQIYIDGQLMKSLDVDCPHIDWYGGFFWDGAAFNTYYRPRSRNSVMWSELRIWDVVRTQEEIQEYMYSVNPQTPGLFGYWKMNDGPGDSRTIKDYSPHGNDGIAMKMNSGNNDSDKVPATTDFTWYEKQVLTIGQ